jgi:mannan endo-1,4-beta-mannosidase
MVKIAAVRCSQRTWSEMRYFDPRGWSPTRRVLAVLAALACGALCLVAVAEVGTTPSPSFVTKSGAKLMLNGKVFRFSGANISWGGLDQDGAVIDYPSQFQVNTALATVANMGGTVVRCHTCGISTGNPQSVEPSLGTFNATALAHIDYFVAQAGKDGIRLDIPLVDNWDFYDGPYRNFTDWLGLSTPSNCPSAACASQFYNNPRAIAAFEQYISVLLNHVNIYTGVANKDNPTVMSWETGNELPYGLGGAPEQTKWTTTISAYIKSIAPHQLVTDGSFALNPGNLKLANVDIVDQHLYPWPLNTPLGTSLLAADASQTTAASKPLVIGEYAWTSSTGLAPFLSAITSNANISGDLYWDLLPPNDDFGFEEDFDGYQLHFPGDNSDVAEAANLPPVSATSSDGPLVTQLRSHAYAMTGTAVPAYAVPGTPVITNVERVAGAISGSGNIVEWKGADGAATYVVSRSTAGATGPWTAAGSISATWQEPWLDSGGPAGPNVWYEVTAVSPGGASGPASAAFQMKDLTLDDNAANFSLTHTHASDVTIDTSTPSLYAGDVARMAFGPADPYAYVVWQAAGPIQTIEALAYYSPNTNGLTIQVSADDATWVSVPASDVQVQPLLVGASNNATQVIFTIDGVQSLLPGARYVSVLRGANSAGTAELGEIRVTYAPLS